MCLVWVCAQTGVSGLGDSSHSQSVLWSPHRVRGRHHLKHRHALIQTSFLLSLWNLVIINPLTTWVYFYNIYSFLPGVWMMCCLPMMHFSLSVFRVTGHPPASLRWHSSSKTSPHLSTVSAKAARALWTTPIASSSSSSSKSSGYSPRPAPSGLTENRSPQFDNVSISETTIYQKDPVCDDYNAPEQLLWVHVPDQLWHISSSVFIRLLLTESGMCLQV